MARGISSPLNAIRTATRQKFSVLLREPAVSLARAAVVAVGLSWAGCCSLGPDYTAPAECPPGTVPTAPAVATTYPNPVFVPIADPQCAWETIVDVVDDYFRIDHEEPVRQVGSTVLEGNITTAPQISPTVLEPWRHDTVDPDQRWENTLQTMRRRATVRVAPAQGGYLVDVQVYKELEDNRRPDQSSAGSATFRYDSSLTGVVNPVEGAPTTLGWIARGRDTSMEQHILAHLLSRSGQAGAPTVLPGPVVAGNQVAPATLR